MTHLRSTAAPDDDQEEATTRANMDSLKLRSEARLVAGPMSPQSPSSRVADSEPGHMSRSSAMSVALPVRQMQENSRLGPYQLVCELASGGMATVYLALYRSIEGFEKLCAVKRIHPHLAGERAFADMFADEAQIAARISHPYVCSVFSFGKSLNSHYIAMEFLRGEPLSAVSRRVARTPQLGDDPRFPALAARLVANFAEGLHAAHTLRDEHGAAMDVVHRDVTPQNLFVMYDGSVRVTDFGIAHARRRLHQTEGQKLKGKLSYIAPEQLNEGQVDLRVDVWGLGVVLWELLAGRRLFLGSNEGETLAAVMSRVVRPPSSFRASVPAELDRIVLRALERDLHKRYRSARDLARDLERFLSSCGDAVPAMDVADWMTQVFPQGAERIQALTELASRVSSSTVDETVVRVPSAPPAKASLAELRLFPTPVFATQPPAADKPAPKRPMVVVQPESAVLVVPSSKPSATPIPVVTPVSSLSDDDLLTLRPQSPGRPKLALEEQSDVRAARLSPSPNSGRNRVIAAAAVVSLALVAVGSTVLLKKNGATPHAAATGAPYAAIAVAPAEPQKNVPATIAEPPVKSVLDLAPVLVPSDLPSPAATPSPRSKPGSATAAKPAAPSEAPAVAAPKPSEPDVKAVEMGDIMITTPGGNWDVSENGRALGRTPGSFRLTAGSHELTLRNAAGVEHRLAVRVVANAPTVVTLPLSN